MSRHSKELTKKQKTFIYISCTAASVMAAIGAVILIIHLVQNPPPVVFSSGKLSHTSNYSAFDTLSNAPQQQTQNSTQETNDKNSILKGVSKNTVYYTTQCATIEDDNIDIITLNGKRVDPIFLIEGNLDTEHHIVVTYKDETTKKFSIKTMPISSLLDPLGDVNELNATLDHLATINSILKKAEALERKYSPYTEVEAVESVITICNSMIDNINTATDELEKIKEKFNKYEGEIDSTSNLDNLMKFSTEIDALLICHNLNSTQRMELVAIDAQCDKWISDINILEEY